MLAKKVKAQIHSGRFGKAAGTTWTQICVMLTSRVSAVLALATTAFVLAPPPALAQGGGKIRTYNIEAVECEWDYAPWFNGVGLPGDGFNPNPIFGTPSGALGEATFLAAGMGKGIGKVYTKALYRLAGEGCVRDPKEQYLGTLGPIIRAEVGDTIVVNLTNYLSSDTVSLHPHGVFYEKAHEGAFYDDDDGVTAGDAIPPGSTYTYTWKVPSSAGPGPSDPSSVVWVYHSHTSKVTAEIQAGLSGVIVVTKKGSANADGSPKDVDKEFVSLYAVFDENRSIYDNADKCASPCGLSDDDFHESNLMHGINGLLWTDEDSNGDPLYKMNSGDKVRWYIGSLGSEIDFHTAHWHGNTVLDHGGHRTDVPEVLPGAFKLYDLEAGQNTGEWIFHCHVEDHVAAGMTTTYQVD